jgi:hypothetical protein
LLKKIGVDSDRICLVEKNQEVKLAVAEEFPGLCTEPSSLSDYDMALVATRFSSHLEIIKQCSKNGPKNIFITKPLAGEKKSINKISELKKISGMRIVTGQHSAFSPAVEATSDYIAKSGQEILSINLVWQDNRSQDLEHIGDVNLEKLPRALTVLFAIIKRRRIDDLYAQPMNSEYFWHCDRRAIRGETLEKRFREGIHMPCSRIRYGLEIPDGSYMIQTDIEASFMSAQKTHYIDFSIGDRQSGLIEENIRISFDMDRKVDSLLTKEGIRTWSNNNRRDQFLAAVRYFSGGRRDRRLSGVSFAQQVLKLCSDSI